MNLNVSQHTDAPVSPHTGTVTELSDFTSVRARWGAHLRDLGRSMSSRTTYDAGILNLQRYLASRGISRLESVGPDNLVAWQAHLVAEGCSPATRNLFARTAKGLFLWLHERGELFLNPAADLTIPKVPAPTLRCPELGQVKLLLASVGGPSRVGLRDRALLELAYSSAARLGELHRLDIGSLDLENGVVRLRGKGDRERVAPIGRAACDTVGRYISEARPGFLHRTDESVALWLSARGGRLGRTAIEQVVRRRSAACGLALTPHDLRRAAATHLLQNGMPLAFIKELLGHAGYRHLTHYLRVQPVDALAETKDTQLLRR